MKLLPALLILSYACFVQSMFKKNEITMDKLDSMLRKSGWTSCSKNTQYSWYDTAKGYEFRIIDVVDLVAPKYNRKIVTVDNLKRKSIESWMVLSSVYYRLLTPIVGIYIKTASRYMNSGVAVNKLSHLMSVVESITVFEPLFQCMKDTLMSFKKKNSIAAALEKLTEFPKKDYREKKFSKPDYKNHLPHDVKKIDQAFQKIIKYLTFGRDFDEFKENSKHQTTLNERMYGTQEPFILNYLQTIVADDTENYFIEADQAGIDEKIKNGIAIFCVNFGYEKTDE